MAKSSQSIGFSVGLPLEWLEQAAALVSLGRSSNDVRESIHSIIGEERLADPTKRADSRTRTVSVVMNLWVEPMDSLVGLRDRAIDLLPSMPTSQHLALHWGMSMAAYPFFACVAENTGRLLRLQGVASGADVYRRVAERYGERPTTKRATNLAMTTLVRWGALTAESKGEQYARPDFRPAESVALGADVSAWLIEALLVSTERDSVTLQELVGSPAVFPFAMSPDTETAVADSVGLRTMGLGVSDVSVALAKKLPGC